MTTSKDSARKAFLGTVTLILLALIGAPLSFAQTNEQRHDALMTRLQQTSPKLGAQDKYISGGLRNALNLAKHWNTIKTQLNQAAATRLAHPAAVGVTTSGLASREAGFTQSETSTAWCGTNAVVGFNDSGSFLETQAASLSGTSGLSLLGYAQSTNANTTTPTFADIGPVPAGPIVSGAGLFVAADPVLGCSSASDFFVSDIGFDCSSFVNNGGVAACAAAQSNVSVSASTDGGATFAAPSVAIAKNFPDHTLDKDWMVVDSAHGEIYVTYTDIDSSSGNVCGTDVFQIQRIAIELVSSSDGGATWSAPTEVTHVCADLLVNPNTSVTGSQIAVAPDGSVYVAWLAIGLGGGNPAVREIDIAKSGVGGASFGASNKITAVNCVGDCTDGTLQGSIRIAELPSLAMGKGTRAGKLFMAWNDGDNPQNDALIGTYNFADVKLVSSSNGVTWSAPVKANINVVSNTDHFQPAVSCDKAGRIAVCFYDRRNDPNNFLIDRYCASSTNGGATFTNTRITSKNFASVVSQDSLIAPNYMGDYDTLTSDTMNTIAGFRGSFADNITGAPNVQANKF